MPYQKPVAVFSLATAVRCGIAAHWQVAGNGHDNDRPHLRRRGRRCDRTVALSRRAWRGAGEGAGIGEARGRKCDMSNFGTIQALPRIARADPETSLVLESLIFSVAAADEEAQMRLRAFLEKRAQKVAHP